MPIPRRNLIAAELESAIGAAAEWIAHIRLATRSTQIVLFAMRNQGIRPCDSVVDAKFVQHLGHVVQVVRVEILRGQLASAGGRQDFECHDETLVGESLPAPITCVMHHVPRFPKQVSLEDLDRLTEHTPSIMHLR
ncbi:MAG: hypothetical protein JWN70_3112 [Planctomycetaceae bacterium]|nr:hypothetical protein [Planctomycetaceae bacterium]